MADVRLTATNPEDSSVVPVACDASGRLLLEEMPPAFDGTVDGDLTVTGKGTFAGGKSIIGNDGSAQFAQGAVDIYANGTVEFTQDIKFSSATFAGNVESNGYLWANGPGSYIVVSRTGAAGNTTVAEFGGDSVTSRIAANGSATFGAGYKVGIRPTSQDNADQFYIDKTDGTRSFSISGSGLTVTKGDICVGGNFPSTNVRLNAQGSVTFAGNKAGFTAEGYLWCTTRRGDTVILDATSNGLASWVEYTPTTRIEEIRDGLNAIPGDAAEMPTDTP